MSYRFTLCAAALLMTGVLFQGTALAEQPAQPAGLLTPAEIAQMRHALNRLARQNTAPAQVKAFVERHRFDCSAPDGSPAAFTARTKLSCEVYNTASDDPSPWPELILGVTQGRIAAALMPAEATAPKRWTCRLTQGAQAKLCALPGTRVRDQRAWQRQWASLLKSAD